jgi:cell filamentation protein
VLSNSARLPTFWVTAHTISRTCERSTASSSRTCTTGPGDVRTVGIEKGDESFCPPGSIGQPMDHVAAEIHRLKQLKAVPEADLARTVAYLYDYANFAHPFREGNGRSTREFFDLLLSERGAGLDWVKTDLAELHSACHAARAESDLGGLIAMFAKILDADPAYDF